MSRPRRIAAACISVLALAGMSACASKPGNRRVVSDVIESLQLPEAQERCMLDKLEGYTDDQLNAIAEENENWDPASGSTMEQASESMRAFIADYEQCTTESTTPAASGTSEPTGTSEPATDSSEPTATTLG